MSKTSADNFSNKARLNFMFARCDSIANFNFKLLLLEAEKAATCDRTQAINKYEDAISISKRCNFPQEEGLQCKRAVIFCIEQNHVDMVSSFLTQSCNNYEK